MNGAHFKELVNTVCLTAGYTKRKIAACLGVTTVTINNWEQKGVPVKVKPYVISVLRGVVIEG
jgi:DNA-binding XRE family transcriptional regulator